MTQTESISSMTGRRIKLFFHCKSCNSGHLAVGWTDEGVQAYCEDCEKSVADLDFLGQKIAYYGIDEEVVRHGTN